MRHGATLAGEVQASKAFDKQFKPGLSTLSQLECESLKQNQMVLQATSSSGCLETDKQLLEETLLEIEHGWAEGPFELSQLEQGAAISRRFPLVQSNKTRLIH